MKCFFSHSIFSQLGAGGSERNSRAVAGTMKAPDFIATDASASLMILSNDESESEGANIGAEPAGAFD